MQLATLGKTQTMSSREIAELVESRHDKVKQSIERLVERGIILQPPMGNEPELDALGRVRDVMVYRLSKRDTYVAVAQLSPEFTARLVDRWQELEVGQAPHLPQTMAQALRLAADQAEQIEAQQLQLHAQQPAVEFVGRYVDATGLKGFRQVAKLLQLKEPVFREFLTRQKIMYTLGGEWVAYSQHIDAGRFVMKAGVNEETGHAYNPSKFTPKGVEWVAGLIASENASNALKAA